MELFRTISENNIEEAKKIINENPNININVSTPGDGITPLMIAISKNKVDFVELFLSHPKIDVNVRSKHGFIPLSIALENKNIDIRIIKLLLDRPELNVNAKFGIGGTALEYAIAYGNTEIVKLLLDRKDLNVNIPDISGFRPIKKVILTDKIDILKLLLNRPDLELTDTDHTSILVPVILGNNVDALKELIKRPDLNVNLMLQNSLPISFLTSHIRSTEIISVLVQRPDFEIDSVNEKGNTLLHVAVNILNINLVRFLLSNRANPTIPNNDGILPVDMEVVPGLSHNTKMHNKIIHEITMASNRNTKTD